MKQLNNWMKSAKAFLQQLKPTPVFAIYGVMFTLALAADIISKYLVTKHMVLYQSIPLIGQLIKLTYVRNAGAAFSFLANHESPWRLPLFITIACIAIVVITMMALADQHKGWSLMIPFGLISAGATGNLIDRITVGTVVDFIDFSYQSFHFPVFNVADSAVVIGVSWLILITSFQKPSQLAPPTET